MRIYAYYTPLPNRNPLEEAACSVEWSKSWTKYGWEPVMLNPSHASSSGLFPKAQQKVGREALEAPVLSQKHCIAGRYARLCALQAIGGGWMSDYDVLNVGFTPEDALKLQNRPISGNRDEGTWIVYASHQMISTALRCLIGSDLWVGDDFIPEGELLDFTDITSELEGKLFHAQDSGDRLRSEVMRNFKL